ncbi:cell cycle control protein [Apiospora kogelbergensis]|uniref:Pre-mRNA-processing factor 19 n=1 Tax=Apiospora kogelbergensis TaxID=1337665 RepID=A0AAW0QT54_9PEZI
MLCAISGEPPEEPVISKISGNVFEKRLIEKWIEENGKDPITGTELTLDDLLPVKTARVVRPRPPTLTSIPALLSTFQNEWDSMALESFNLREQLQRTREELSTALYQNDAAVRVIARLSRERDEARNALSKVSVSNGNAPAATGTGDDSMAIDSDVLPPRLVTMIEDTQKSLSKSRKKRPVPEGTAAPEKISSYAIQEEFSSPVTKMSAFAHMDGMVSIGGEGGTVCIYSPAKATVEGKIQGKLSLQEPVTASTWTNCKIVLGTSSGLVKVFADEQEIASFSEHAGPVTGLATHPSEKLLASVGSDKSIVFYDHDGNDRVARVFTDSALTTCAFHPDGHLFAAGTESGEIKVFMTATCEQATSFSLGAPVHTIVFSENGFWFAAAGKGTNSVVIFDIRKQGDAAKVKSFEVDGAVESLAWDYSQQFLAIGATTGVVVQHYAKSSKSWSEILKSDFPAKGLDWSVNATSLVAADQDGQLAILSTKE